MIGELSRDTKLQGKVIPLAFHVDYWNQLGWRDPYSSPEWSQRQAAYVRAMNLDSAYTPQAVVNGTTQTVGSNRKAIYDAIERASHEPSIARVSIANGVAKGWSLRDADLIALVVRSDAPTSVKSGENEGRTLRNDAVVRKLTHVARVKGEFTHNIGDANVVLLQDPTTLKIYAATAK